MSQSLAAGDLLASVDGVVKPAREATISIFDHSFHYGDAAFEGIKFLNGKIFDLRLHVARLYRSLKALMIELPLTPDALARNIVELVRANGMRDGYLRVVVSRGSGPLGLRNMDQITTPTVVIVCQPERAKSPEELIAAPGKRGKTVSTRRTPPQSVDPRIKSCNYVNNILADFERRAAGLDFALMLDMEGYLCEGVAENVFVVHRNTLLTPFAAKCLDGITRQNIMALAPALGLKVVEANLTLYDAYEAEEMFSTGSLNDITWIGELDSRKIGSGQVGPIVRKLLPAIREKGFAESTPIEKGFA